VLLLLALSWAGLCAPAAMASADDASPTLQVFVRDGCPHCRDAKRYLAELQRQQPQLRIVFRDVVQDPVALAELEARARASGSWPPGVPTFVFGEHMIVGFSTPDRIGPEILALLATYAPNPSVSQPRPVPDHVDTVLFGSLSAAAMGLPLFTLSLGLLDGFNPCATWVLLFLLSLLVRLHDRRRMALIAGTFVLVSGAVYYAFMAAWLNVFLLIGWSAPLRWAIAIVAVAIGAINVKDFFAFRQGPSLSIPEAAHPGIYARARNVLRADAVAASLLSVAALAVVVNFVELLCTAGFPAIYTAVLTQHDLSPWQHYAYLGLYIAGYIADDSLMVAVAVWTLGNHRLTERGGRWLKLIAGSVMLALGATLILRPQWLM
jgi:glutaredoxin